jgi:hypothetical protein
MYENFPGGDILENGLRSLGQGRVDENSLLVMIGAWRLGRCGINIQPLPTGTTFPEDAFYRLLSRKYGPDAYRMYNSLMRRLVSLESAMEQLRNAEEKNSPST